MVSQEKYDVINTLGEKFDKEKKYNEIYYKTTQAKKVHFIDNKYHNWSVFINFDQFSFNIDAEGQPNSIDFHNYLTEEDLQYMKLQVKSQNSKKWIRSKLAENIKLYKSKKSGFSNVLSEPVFSIDGKIALVYWSSGGGAQMNVYNKENGRWQLLGVIPLIFS